MPFYLLSGAGFSRNWGGILAPEMFNQLIGSSLIDDELRRMLWRDRSFEDVLAALQAAADDEGKRRYRLLVSEIVGIFNGMTQSFERTFRRAIYTQPGHPAGAKILAIRLGQQMGTSRHAGHEAPQQFRSQWSDSGPLCG